MVVDDTGRSFDLVRQLTGIKSKEVKERLKDEKLQAEKDVIHTIRSQQHTEALNHIIEPQHKPGYYVDQYEQKKIEALQEYQETEREQAIRELKQQLEEQRQLARDRSR